MRVELIDCGSALWNEALSVCVHDVYHTPGWIAASRHCDVGEPLAVLVQSGAEVALFPLLKRDLGAGSWDATSAYGYGGPIFSRDHSASWVDESLAAAVSALREAGCVSWFVRLHPILNANWTGQAGVVVSHGPTVSIDLKKSAEQHWRETMSGHRGDINRSVKAGVQVEIGGGSEQLAQFVRIYHETMSALDASDYYFFKDEYFQDLVRLLGDKLLLIMAREGDSYIGGSMFTTCESSGLMQYHLSGTSVSFRHRQPSKLILHFAREWGREHGFLRLHLGGGVGAQEDALFKFKRGFSPDTHVFQSLRIVVDVEKYKRLCGDRGLDANDLSGFFPMYRNPKVQGG